MNATTTISSMILCAGLLGGCVDEGRDFGGFADENESTGDTETGETETGETGEMSESETGEGEPMPEPHFEPGKFWRLESPADGVRTWLVSPAGERVFMLGVNTVLRAASCDGIEEFLNRAEPSEVARVEWARLTDGQVGDAHVPAPYCFNSVGAFSQVNDLGDRSGDSYMIRPYAEGGAGAPYMVVLSVSPGGDDRALRDADGNVLVSGVAGTRVGDPYNPAFAADIDAMVAERVAPRVEDPALQMWTMGNEIGIFDRASKGEGVRDFRRQLWSTCPLASSIDSPQCAADALAAVLRERYVSVAALDQAWGSDYAQLGADFSTLFELGPKPRPGAAGCSSNCAADLQIFVHDHLLREWITLVTTRVRAVDPHHLIASPRLAIGGPGDYRFWTGAGGEADVWADDGEPLPADAGEVHYRPFDLFAREGAAGFDLVALNAYDGGETFEPQWFGEGVERIWTDSGLPIVISEFGIRAKIDGWSNRGGAMSFVPKLDEIDDQLQRGQHYQSQLAQFYAFPFIVGANWHAWSDRYLADDPDTQMNMGLVHCDDDALGFEAGARWQGIDEGIAATNCEIMQLIADATGW